MKCLYCGRKISESATAREKLNRWHNSCIKKFFGTSNMPVIDISNQKLQELANETVTKGLTVPGVQKKLSLHLSKVPEERLTLVDYPAGYILKPQAEEYEMLPEFENLAMRMAKLVGINTVDNALMFNNGQYAYITRRADRLMNDCGMLAMEDFCQLAERLTIDKYKGSYEKCAGIIDAYSSRKGLDMTELFIRIVFSFIIGNSDMHLKNFSMMETAPGSRKYCISPAYDMLPVNIILPEDKDQMALTINGKRSNLKRRDFIDFARKCGINENAANKMILRLCNMQERILGECEQSYLSEELQIKMKDIINDRIEILKKI